MIDRGVYIVLYPDKDATDKWTQLAKEIGYKHLIVNEEFMKMFWREEDGEKADIADVLIRLMKPKVEQMYQQCPKTKQLKEIFPNLELISINKLEEKK